MKQETAVEWYSQQHLKLLIKLENKELSIGEYAVQHQEILNKAKELEKQQIIEAWIAEDNPLQRLRAEQYYNETFNNK
jgi:hypothetical protein